MIKLQNEGGDSQSKSKKPRLGKGKYVVCVSIIVIYL